MTLQVGVGSSRNRNPERAGAEAAAAALAQAGIDKPDWVLLYATVGYDQQALVSAVREATGNAPLTGCSGEGVIAQGVIDEGSHAVSVMVWKSDRLRWRTFRAEGLSGDARAVGASIASQIGKVPDDGRILLILTDGLVYSHDKFTAGLHGGLKLDRRLPLVGGNAADAFTQTKTFQYHDGEVYSDGVSVALLSGQGEIVTEVTHGCVPIGAPRTITRCVEDIVYEIDDKPARDVLAEYLSPEEMEQFGLNVVSLSLGLQAPSEVAPNYDDLFIRGTAPGPDDPKSLRVYTTVEKGQKIWMTRRDPDKIRAGVDRLTERVRQRLSGDPKVILHVECLGRGKHMWSEEDRTDFQQRLQRLAPGVPWIGFYSYGEIAPIGENDFFHNFTSVITALR